MDESWKRGEGGDIIVIGFGVGGDVWVRGGGGLEWSGVLCVVCGVFLVCLVYMVHVLYYCTM